MTNFTTNILNKEGGTYRLIMAQENGQDAWFLLEMEPAVYAEYKRKLREGHMNVRDYGTIHRSGWGEPPQDVIDWIDTYQKSQKE